LRSKHWKLGERYSEAPKVRGCRKLLSNSEVKRDKLADREGAGKASGKDLL